MEKSPIPPPPSAPLLSQQGQPGRTNSETNPPANVEALEPPASPGGSSTTPQAPPAIPPHALLPKDGQSIATATPKPMGMRGKRSPFDDMDPRLANTIDNELVSGLYSLRILSIKYGLTQHQLRWRKRVLHQAMGKGKAGELVGRAGEAMDWAAERTKEVYQAAAEHKIPVIDPSTGAPLMTTLEQAGKEIQTALLMDSPDLPTMLEAVKQMHALARSFGEFEQKIGKIAELKAQKELGIGLGANGGQGPGGWGGVGQLNVLVMPKEAGVEAGGPMPKFQIPAPPPVQQGQLESGEVIDAEEMEDSSD